MIQGIKRNCLDFPEELELKSMKPLGNPFFFFFSFISFSLSSSFLVSHFYVLPVKQTFFSLSLKPSFAFDDCSQKLCSNEPSSNNKTERLVLNANSNSREKN